MSSSPLSRRALLCRAASAALAPTVLAAPGCARQPPSRNTLSGRRLRVTLRYSDTINPNFFYYFLIRYDTSQGVAGDSANSNGPIPVISPPYGNGFATGVGGTAGFTDFVRFHAGEVQGYGLYHVIGDPNSPANFGVPRVPVAFTLPSANPDDLQSTVLQFEIDMSQLVFDASGQPLVDQNEALQRAQAIRFLQVNAISTDVTPISNTPIVKQVDAFGNTRVDLGVGSYVQIDMTQFGRVYTSADFEPEPEGDVLDGNDPRLDLIEYRIEPLNISR